MKNPYIIRFFLCFRINLLHIIKFKIISKMFRFNIDIYIYSKYNKGIYLKLEGIPWKIII